VVAGALWGTAVGLATRRLLQLLATADSIQITQFFARLLLHRQFGVSLQY
jgi:hypothetical protein